MTEPLGGRNYALTDGRWVLDRRRRIQVWVPNPVVMHPSEWQRLQEAS